MPRFLLLLAAVCNLPPGLAAAQGACADTTPHARRSLEWRAPRLLWRSFNDSASVHPNHVASDANQIVIASEFAFSDTGVRERRADPTAPLAIRVDRRTGRITELRKPHPTWSYTGTRVAIDGGGVPHLLWSEVAGVTVTDTVGGRNAVQIWSSRIVGDSVTAPQFLAASRFLNWGYDRSTHTVGVDSSGNVYAVLLADRRPSRSPFMFLTRSKDRWKVQVPDLGGLVAATAVGGVKSSGIMHVVFASPVFPRRTSVFGSVFYASGHPDSIRWSPPVLVHDADSTGDVAQFPRISSAASGEIRAFWMVPAVRNTVFERMEILTASKPRGAAKFGPAHRYAPITWLRDFESAWTDACDVTHVHALTGRVGTTGAAALLDWDGRSWTEHPPFTFNWQYLDRSVLSVTPSGELTRVWSSALYGPGLPMILFWYASDQRVGLPHR